MFTSVPSPKSAASGRFKVTHRPGADEPACFGLSTIPVVDLLFHIFERAPKSTKKLVIVHYHYQKSSHCQQFGLALFMHVSWPCKSHCRSVLRKFRQNRFLHVQPVLRLIENCLRVRFERRLSDFLAAMRG